MKSPTTDGQLNRDTGVPPVRATQNIERSASRACDRTTHGRDARVTGTVLATLLTLLIAAPVRGETWAFKKEMLPAVVKAVPNILKTQDPKTGQFGSGTWIVTDQNVMYPLAVAWATKIDGVENPYYHDPKLLDALMAGGDALIAAQDPKGMWTFRKKDNSTWGQIYMPWTYSRWIRAYSLIKDAMPQDRREKWDKALLLGFDGIYKTDTKKPMQNIPVHNCMGLYLAGKIFDKPEWQTAAVEYLHKCVAAQHPDGYWTEHKGPVVIYNGVYVDALGAYYGMSGDKIVLDALERSAKFHAAMTYPDGRAVETVDERNPYHENIAGHNVGFSFSPIGRRYVKQQTERLSKYTDTPVAPDLAASFILYGQEGELAPPPQAGEMYVSGDKQVLTRRATPWFVCMTSYTAEIDPRRWIQDRQNFFSLYHDEGHAILGGGNTKLQPLWSTFTVGDVSLLKHKPGDESPNFLPPPGLKHTPSDGRLIHDDNTVELDYGGVACSVHVDIADAKRAKITYTLHTPSAKDVAAHVPILPELKAKWSTASGKSGTLGEEPIDLKPGEAGAWFAHRGFRINIPEGASITWPAKPHNPYAKDGRSELGEARIVITMPLDSAHTHRDITVERDEAAKD